MLKKVFITVFSILFSQLFAQNSLIEVDEANKDIGSVENIYKIKSDFIIKNNQSKKLYLLRADALKGMTIQSSKKTIQAGDTALIVIEFIPQHTGKFKENIKLVTSADGEPFQLSVSGTIKSIKTDDKTACFYFKKPNNKGVNSSEPIVAVEPIKPRDTSNKLPDNTSNTQVKETNKQPDFTEPAKIKGPTFLDEDLYKPNNIIFLVDVSSSMRDTNKLKVMQYALHHLITVLRPKDKITFITYADSVKMLQDGVHGSDKEILNKEVDKLKAKGLTKGNKAILFSLDVALKNYIPEGNNQIILATDGKFRFYPDDQKKYLSMQGNKQVILSTMAFGNDKDALKNLKEIAETGRGHFMHIKNKTKAEEQLLDEVKQNSLIH